MELRRIGAIVLGGLVVGLGLDVPAASATLAPGGTMQVSPTSTTPGSTVTVSGDGCLGDYEIQVRLDQGQPVATSGDPSDDSWSVQLPVPAGTTPGSHQITATCDSYNNVDDYEPISLTVVAAATSTSTTTSTTSPTGASASIGVRSVPQGGSFDFQGGGFNPGETVDVTIFSDPVKVASLTASAAGTVSGRATVPTSVETGTHRLELKGASSGKTASVTFTVTAAGTTAVAAAGAGLPDTGSSTGPTSVAAMSALVVGAILLITAARLRTGAMASIAAAQAQARAEQRPLPSSAVALATILVGVGLARSRKASRTGRPRS